MKSHYSEEQLINYLEEGKQDTTISKHLSECDSCSVAIAEFEEVFQAMGQVQDLDPPSKIRWAVESAIEEEKDNLVTKSATFNYWKLVAAVTLILGFFFGQFLKEDRSDEIIALQSQVDLLKELTAVNTLQSHTASERIQAVNMIEEDRVPKVSEKLINTLIRTLNNDESPNVRYAAAQALSRFIDQENVRLSLTKSLESQTDPLIQISLISMLVEAQEKNAVRPIKDLMNQESTSTEVKKQAKIALEILT